MTSFFKNVFFLILFSTLLSAQSLEFVRQIDPFPISDRIDEPFSQAFFGGLNAPIQQFLDIDNDGDSDLFIQDRANQLIYFRNDGSAEQSNYRWISDNYQSLVVGAWFKFSDVDNDGDFDLFAEKPFGVIRYYQNIGSPTLPNFVVSVDSLRDVNGDAILVEGFSVPEWADLYCQNRNDLYLGRQSGSITQYQLTGFDAQNVPVYQKITDTFEDILILTGGGFAKTNADRHGANSMTFVDIDNDSDLDLFWGDFFANSIIYIENKGNCNLPDFDNDDIIENFPQNDPISTGGLNIPRFSDIDNDNDFDMFVSVIGGASSFVDDKSDNFYFYENIGTPQTANFVQQSKSYVNALDIGQNTIPAFADIDADGDYDLFLANQEDLNAPNTSNSRLWFYENTGSSTAPEFLLRDSNYLNDDRPVFDSNYAPIFYDYDGDGDLDLFTGNWDGKIVLWENSGSAQNAVFSRSNNVFQGIDVGNFSTPDFVDIDADGDEDLFIGESSGNINFYRNIGSIGNPNYELVTTTYLDIDLGIGEHSYPRFVDLDNDGDKDFLLGSKTQGTFFYRNSGTAQQANFVLDTTFEIPVFIHNTPNPIDIDGDGNLDLFLGVNGGGIVFFRNSLSVGIASNNSPQTIPNEIELLQNYPNPFNPQTTISYSVNRLINKNNDFYKLIIYNNLGEEIRRWNLSNESQRFSGEIVWDGKNSIGENVTSGVYFYLITSSQNRSKTQKMLLIK